MFNRYLKKAISAVLALTIPPSSCLVPLVTARTWYRRVL